MTTTTPTTTTLDLLQKFVDQRPGLNFADYGDVRAYRNEAAEITRDRADFYELRRLVSLIGVNVEEKATDYLQKSSGRLTLEGGRLLYITGQYFPTEYRAAACRVLSSIIWRHFAANCETGDGVREEIRRFGRRWNMSRRVMRFYFS